MLETLLDKPNARCLRGRSLERSAKNRGYVKFAVVMQGSWKTIQYEFRDDIVVAIHGQICLGSLSQCCHCASRSILEQCMPVLPKPQMSTPTGPQLLRRTAAPTEMIITPW